MLWSLIYRADSSDSYIYTLVCIYIYICMYIYIHVDCTSHSISRDVSNYRNNKNLFPLPLRSSSSVSHSVVSDSLRPHGLSPTRLLCPWDSPGKNTGMGCHSLLQGIFPTQGLNPGLLHYRQILCHLNHQGSYTS